MLHACDGWFAAAQRPRRYGRRDEEASDGRVVGRRLGDGQAGAERGRLGAVATKRFPWRVARLRAQGARNVSCHVHAAEHLFR